MVAAASSDTGKALPNASFPSVCSDRPSLCMLQPRQWAQRPDEESQQQAEMGDQAIPFQPLQHLQRALEGCIRNLEVNRRQLHQQLDNSLQKLCLASLTGGVQASVPVRNDALVSAAALAAKIGALFQQPKQPDMQLPAGDGRVVCLEFTKGKRRVYRRKAGSGSGGKGKGKGEEGFDVTDDQVTHRARMADVFADYLLPQGFPDSVAPQYATYMAWRGVQYFFGGAMSVFTTRALLAALGISKHTGEAAAAINWVLKDGAGRLGRFLFARWGRQLDCELKQFRLAGDVLMEAGAALELATVLVPQAFLALACTANLAKNLAAVAASATRAPIYRTFAKHNNLADITAKGESVANLADILGTAFGIALAKMNLPVLPTFCLLSVGYLISSRKEVDSVVLPYLNRARLSYTCRTFLDSGKVPEPPEANAREPLTPWADPVGSRIVLGASVAEACADPATLEAALRTFPGRQYAITYRPDTRKAYVLLKEGVNCQQMLRATFDAQVLIFMLNRSSDGAQAKAATGAGSNSSNGAVAGRKGKGGAARPLLALDRAADALDQGSPSSRPRSSKASTRSRASIGSSASSSSSSSNGGGSSHEEAVQYVAAQGPELYRQFEKQALERGWKMNLTMLNASETRLRIV